MILLRDGDSTALLVVLNDTVVYPVFSKLYLSKGFYLSVLLGGLDHVHVHIIHQVGHLWHVLDDLVRLSRSISLRKGNGLL